MFFCQKTHFSSDVVRRSLRHFLELGENFICSIIYSTRSVDLWYFQIHKLFFGARMDGVLSKFLKIDEIDQNLHQIPNLRVQNDGLRDILVHVG